MSDKIFEDGIKSAVSLIAIAGKTAPKAKGLDALEIKVMTPVQKKKIVAKMKEIAKTGEHGKIFLRDSAGVAKADAIILIGSSDIARGLDCRFCGGLCKTRKGICAYTGVDLGIALGSMVSTASALKIDNRIMYTAGYAAVNGGFLSKKIKAAFGISLSVSSKNIFFDRK
ncbi:MAG: DUF2148 domain-containing protein [bacterium]